MGISVESASDFEVGVSTFQYQIEFIVELFHHRLVSLNFFLPSRYVRIITFQCE